jgi:hypothetical protein
MGSPKKKDHGKEGEAEGTGRQKKMLSSRVVVVAGFLSC